MKAMLPASAAPPAHRPIRSNDDRRRARTVSAIKDAGEIGVGDAIGTAEIAAFPEPAIFDRAAIAAAAAVIEQDDAAGRPLRARARETFGRSEERRVGNECVRRYRSRW